MQYRDYLKEQELLPLPVSDTEMNDLRIVADHIAEEIAMFSLPAKVKCEYIYLTLKEINCLKNKKFDDYKLWRQNGVL